MKNRYLLAAVLVVVGALGASADDSSTAAIDASVWNVISATVAQHDIDGMAATYHPDGVFVYGQGTSPIATQLAKWGEAMEGSKTVGTRASVSFRFTSRQDDGETAFESGFFRYSETDSSGVENTSYVPFEALLVKKNGTWLIVMERQLPATDEAAWNSLAE